MDQVVEISQEYSSNSRVKSISLEIEEEDSQRAAHKFIQDHIAKRKKQKIHESSKSSHIDSKEGSVKSKKIQKSNISTGNDNLSNFMSFKDAFNSDQRNLDFETNSISSNKFGGNTSCIAPQQSFHHPQMISKSKSIF